MKNVLSLYLLLGLVSIVRADVLMNFDFEAASGQDTIAALEAKGWVFTDPTPVIASGYNNDNHLKCLDTQGGTLALSEPIAAGGLDALLVHSGSRTYTNTSLDVKNTSGEILFRFRPYRQNGLKFNTGNGELVFDGLDENITQNGSKIPWRANLVWIVNPDGTSGTFTFVGYDQNEDVFLEVHDEPFMADGIPAKFEWMNGRTGRTEYVMLYDIKVQKPIGATSKSVINLKEEGSTTDSFDLVLLDEILPGSPDITVSLGDPSETNIIIDPNAYVFNSSNWNIPQSVPVKAVDDTIVEGPASYRVEFTVTSDDPNIATLIIPITVNVEDNDNGFITIDTADGVKIEEEGPTSDTYAISLSDKPTAPVVITVNVDSEQVTVDPITLTFTATDWAAKSVTVTAVDDDGTTAEEAVHLSTITHSVVTESLEYTVYNDGGPQTVDSVEVEILNNDCDGPYNLFDRAGPDGQGNEYRDCMVDLLDFAYFASQWLDCAIDNGVGCP